MKITTQNQTHFTPPKHTHNAFLRARPKDERNFVNNSFANGHLLEAKTQTLIEALPYIQKYSGKTIVIKYGRNAKLDEAREESLLRDVALLKNVGMKIVIIHGGGPDITKALERAGLKSEFDDASGLRITPTEAIPVIRDVYRKLNGRIVSLLKKNKVRAVEFTGRDQKLVQAKPLPNLGFVGEVVKIYPRVLKCVINEGFIPVISPVGIGAQDHSTYNINADDVAAAIASALGAEKLTILTNVPGVRGEDGNYISTLDSDKALQLIDAKIITGGMIPKVKSCISAVTNGCKKAHLIDETAEHALLLEFFTDKGVGTQFIESIAFGQKSKEK
ncbi:MAG: acetylglutamate kinase [Candidatus Micrarchaeota archaeon]